MVQAAKDQIVNTGISLGGMGKFYILLKFVYNI